MTRQGKHKPMKTLFGAYVDPELKALAVMTADRLGISFTDIILNGLKSEATRAGIMVNGEIAPECQQAYAAIIEIVKVDILNKKQK